MSAEKVRRRDWVFLLLTFKIRLIVSVYSDASQ